MSFEAINSSFKQLTIGNQPTDAAEFPLEELPNELITEIFSFTSEDWQIANLSLVSRRFYVIIQMAHPERTVPDRVAAAIDRIANLVDSKSGVCYLTPAEKMVLKKGSLLPVNAANVPSPRVGRIHHLYSSLENAVRHLVATSPNSMNPLATVLEEKLGKNSNLFKFTGHILSGANALQEINTHNLADNSFKLFAASQFAKAGKLDEALEIVQNLPPDELSSPVIVLITRAFVNAGRMEESILVSNLSQHPEFTPDRVRQFAERELLTEDEYVALNGFDDSDYEDEDIFEGPFEKLDLTDLNLDACFAKNCDDIEAIHWPSID